MYVPEPFREQRPERLHEIIRSHAFGTVVTASPTPAASHVPFVLDVEDGGRCTLLGHVARANPQWRELSPDGEVLVLFQGPHAYVTPSWYRGALHVPTWNYVAVHAYGRPRLLSESELLALLRRLVDEQEAHFERPWSMDVLPTAFVERLAKEIVGFAIAVTRLEGKLKLSQNRDREDRARVAAGLEASGDPSAQATAAWMRSA